MNSSKRFPFLATLLLLALPASGAVRYRFTTEGRGGLAPFDRSGSVFVDGTRARIETKSVDLDSVRLWSAEGQACSHLNSSRKTYYQSGCGLDQMLSFATKTERVAKTTKMNVKLLDEGDASSLAGMKVRKGTIEASWVTEARMGSEWFPVTVARRMEVWVADGISVPAFPFGHVQELKSGVAEVDRQVAEALKKLGSFPLKQMITTTRAFDPKHPTTETLTTVLSDVEEVPADASRFEIPAGYRPEEPAIVAPGGH